MTKTGLLCFSFLLLGTTAISQIGNVSWSDEIKFRKGSQDISVIETDEDGFFLQESHDVLSTYFVFGFSTRQYAKLIRFDKNMNEVYSNDYSKGLKGKQFERFLFIKNKMYIIADDYTKKTRTTDIYGAAIDKKTGELHFRLEVA